MLLACITSRVAALAPRITAPARRRVVRMASSGLTDHEKFLFDLNGYLVVRGALSADEITELNAAIDAHSHEAISRDATALKNAKRAGCFGAKGSRRDLGGMLNWDRVDTLLESLLDKQPASRAADADVATCAFFASIDWDEAASKKLTPPIQPPLPSYVEASQDGSLRFVGDAHRPKNLPTPKRVTFDEETSRPSRSVCRSARPTSARSGTGGPSAASR